MVRRSYWDRASYVIVRAPASRVTSVTEAVWALSNWFRPGKAVECQPTRIGALL
jgi:hypothetical protein